MYSMLNHLIKNNPNNENFFERVYEVARQIPYGKVTSYGAIAKALEQLVLLEWLVGQ